MNTKKEGKKLLEQGQWVLKQEVQQALKIGNYNLVVRRSQEAVELLLKGGVRYLGGDYPKVHDVAPVFCQLVRRKLGTERGLEKITKISRWLSGARAPSFYMERDYSEEDAQRAYNDAQIVIEKVKSVLRIK